MAYDRLDARDKGAWCPLGECWAGDGADESSVGWMGRGYRLLCHVASDILTIGFGGQRQNAGVTAMMDDLITQWSLIDDHSVTVRGPRG